MINDLLDLTRIEQGRVALDQQPADAADLVRDALERYRSAAEDAGITLQCQLEAPLPLVLVDKERIEHVFDNLMTNALRHTERGGTIILRAAAAEGTVQFSVADTGEGIPAQFVPRVFDKFFRTPGAKQQGGAGLGLAIVHEIIVSHGGQIGVQSTIGKGTTFTFSLPAAVSQDEAATGRLDLVSSSSTS